MSEREYFARFAKRVGMYLGRTSLRGVTAFMVGYDQAARRYRRPGLDGWCEWLTANHQPHTAPSAATITNQPPWHRN
ncbi:hypothetical protein [Nocardia sp. CA-120079]|uniref:hypothetical protein n=1 Tax=Nocardia sp. CA-120079 TaxID=3239974 RepID=UPI003D986F34